MDHPFKREREKLFKSQTWLAHEIGLTQSRMSQFERGFFKARSKVVNDVAEVLGLSYKNLRSRVTRWENKNFSK